MFTDKPTGNLDLKSGDVEISTLKQINQNIDKTCNT